MNLAFCEDENFFFVRAHTNDVCKKLDSDGTVFKMEDQSTRIFLSGAYKKTLGYMVFFDMKI